MRFWWPGSRTPILLMSLQVGRDGELETGMREAGNYGPEEEMGRRENWEGTLGT